ncbi:MAG: hypothetical protein K1X60_04650 [Nitrospira sp.]|nr:hypothetical protein [Nitrospira sp.]MCW5796548.1 hypothetical protein [Nitrospira sp.]
MPLQPGLTVVHHPPRLLNYTHQVMAAIQYRSGKPTAAVRAERGVNTLASISPLQKQI